MSGHKKLDIGGKACDYSGMNYILYIIKNNQLNKL